MGYVLSAAILALAAVLPQHSTAAERGGAGYRLGDRLPQNAAPAKAAGIKEINWDALMPTNWNPMKSMEAINLGAMNDGDPRAQKALEQMREAWNNAPVSSALNGTRVRIAGFVVPLEGQRGEVSEFLLVPYFGACIHTPPPPPNQIIHVNPAQPLKSEAASEAVWVSGILETVRSETGMGNASYRMRGVTVTPYRKP
jgi:hypothetical protein